MKIHGYQRLWKAPFFTNRKHHCPKCGGQLDKIKVSQVLPPESELRQELDRSYGASGLHGNIKYVWTEFQCPGCGRQYSIDTIKKIEEDR